MDLERCIELVDRNRASQTRHNARHLAELTRLGIRRLTIWECALKGRSRHDPDRLLEVVAWWLTSGAPHAEIAGGHELFMTPAPQHEA